MPAATPADLFAFLEELGIATSTIEHPPLFTVEESRALRGAIAGGHTKNLFLKDKKGRLFLVTAEEETAIDLKRLHEPLGASGRFSFGSAEAMLEVLGVTPGAVTAFGVLNDRERRVTMVLDRRLTGYEMVNCHPLVNTRTTSIATKDLLRFLEATGHPPIVMDLPAPAAAEAPAAP